MNRRQLISVGYIALGVVLFGSFLADGDVSFASPSVVAALGLLLGTIGSAGMVVIGVGSLLWPDSRWGLNRGADSPLYLYLIWGAVALAAAGLALQVT